MEPTKNPHQSELAGASNVAANNEKLPTTTPPAPATVIDRCVVIGQGVGNLYMVSVEPAHPDHPPQIFDCHRKARGYAGGLRMCHRWQIVDQTGEAK
ncbi:hypothetical protein [Croceicoccus marinus]|jgi:hypothetical protein|uniref:Uncharacterized protein n=1 Tax=Croceicoccus marinus TaxID=450378 RepID=A0A7G6VSG3_9SPHN|nr:hypothetical protein [Croceicoccus marinus]QNE04678.1 hypothetical protein H4O24_12035 [Croceicoccus marinus]